MECGRPVDRMMVITLYLAIKLCVSMFHICILCAYADSHVMLMKVRYKGGGNQSGASISTRWRNRQNRSQTLACRWSWEQSCCFWEKPHSQSSHQPARDEERRGPHRQPNEKDSTPEEQQIVLNAAMAQLTSLFYRYVPLQLSHQ